MIHWAAMLLLAVKTQAEIVACIIGEDMALIGYLFFMPAVKIWWNSKLRGGGRRGDVSFASVASAV